MGKNEYVSLEDACVDTVTLEDFERFIKELKEDLQTIKEFNHASSN